MARTAISETRVPMIRPTTYLSFDGTDDYIDLNATDIMPNATEACSIVAWVYTSGAKAPCTIQNIIGNKRDGNTTGWQLKLSGVPTNLLEFGFYPVTPQTNRSWITAKSVPTDRWVRVAYTFDGNTAIAYIDDVKETLATLGTTVTISENDTQNVRIGHRQAAGGSDEFVNGGIAEVAVYNDVLTDAEINSISLGGDYPTGNRLGFWKINDGTGNTIVDTDGLNDGTNNGATWATQTKKTPRTAKSAARSASPTPSNAVNFEVKSIDIMSRSKDTMRSQISTSDMASICESIMTLGATHIAFACPLDDYDEYEAPQPADGYILKWVNAIRGSGASVFWRNTWLNFEGLYDSDKITPSSDPAIATGVAATVLDGTDTSSYLYKCYNFILTHPTWFRNGDVWGVVPEPENTGVGAEATDMWDSFDTLGQFLVDLKTVSDAAFASIGLTGVITGMTAVNGGTVINDSIGSAYWTQIGRCAIDHYAIPSTYSASMDTAYANAEVDIYFGEFGTTGNVGTMESDDERARTIDYVVGVLAGKSYIKSLSYFQAVAYTVDGEGVLDATTFEPLKSGKVLKKHFEGYSRTPI